MPLEEVSVDLSVVVLAPDELPINTEDFARIIAEALNLQYARPGDSFEVRSVNIEGDDAWSA